MGTSQNLSGNKEKRGDLQTGFVLIELLIAITILALIVGLIYGTLSGAVRAAERREQDASIYRSARWPFFVMDKEMSAINGTMTGSSSSLIFLGEDATEFTGTAALPNDTLTFSVVSRRPMAVDTSQSDRIEISYGLEDGVFVRKVAPILSDGEASSGEIGANIVGLNFRYLDPADKTWTDSWDVRLKNKLPLAIEVSLYQKNPEEGKEPILFTSTFELLWGRS